MKNITPQETLKAMELIAEIAAARERREGGTWSIPDLDKLIRTLFPTMCELLEKANEGN